MFDLEKAFDSVEYDILLYHLYNYGINGKTFRIIKSWYTNPTCSVHLNQRTSRKYIVHRGVKQVAVLSPVLFNIIMDRLLQSLNKKPTNLTISIGCAAHADDIRACCVGLDTVKELAVNIDNFAISNSLKLNMSKTEIVHLSCHSLPQGTVDVYSQEVEIKHDAKCLGVWWSKDLSSKRSIEENVRKARRAFFALGAVNVFQGSCNPLTSLSMFITFVEPILLYGCEVWFLTEPLTAMLDRFQAEIGKRILQLPKFHSNISVRVALKWPSFTVLILHRKLMFLAKLLTI